MISHFDFLVGGGDGDGDVGDADSGISSDVSVRSENTQCHV